MPRLARDLDLWRAFWRDAKGNTALIAGLVALPLTLAIGLTIDYANSGSVLSRVNGMADAAVLAATSPVELTKSADVAQAFATTQFRAQAAQIPGLVLDSVVVTVNDVAANGGQTRTAAVAFTAHAPTFFASLIGQDTLSVSGKSAASKSTPLYANVYVLVDVSQSMGIAATQADMNRLYTVTQNATGTGCVFGCHVSEGNYPSNEVLAHSASPKINLRTDAAVSAIQTILTFLEANTNERNYVKIGVATMNADPTNGSYVRTLIAPSNVYSSVSTAADGLALGGNTIAGVGDSNFSAQIAAFSATLPASGNGADAAHPLNYVVLVTDGASDVAGGCGYGHCTSAFDSTLCNQLKLKANVGVIYTTYIPIYTNNNPSLGIDARYRDLVAPFVANIPAALKSCATSSNLYFEASDGGAITTGMTQLFGAALKTAHLTL